MKLVLIEISLCANFHEKQKTHKVRAICIGLSDNDQKVLKNMLEPYVKMPGLTAIQTYFKESLIPKSRPFILDDKIVLSEVAQLQYLSLDLEVLHSSNLLGT